MNITTITNPPYITPPPFAAKLALPQPIGDHLLPPNLSLSLSTHPHRFHSAALPPSPPSQPRRPSTSPTLPPKRRLTTPNACTVCKRAKAKCSGTHPACTRCARRGEGSACRYEADTRSQKKAIVEEIRELRQRYSRAERILLAVGGEEGEGTVRALRRGDSYEEIDRELGVGWRRKGGAHPGRRREEGTEGEVVVADAGTGQGVDVGREDDFVRYHERPRQALAAFGRCEPKH
ncbi:hypothetical protein MMC15_000124 [Xylographa vitiligo]|nr:hypothetical protein [Xylographa vitiligo]